jgi:hypothetical protein
MFSLHSLSDPQHELLHRRVSKKVVVDVGGNNIVQIITDNGSNYKKTYRYLTNEYHK